MNNKIDFVVLWVDGSDKKWLDEKKKYETKTDPSNSVVRFRDWGTLKYWFRGVEKFAPWVNKIYFVTYGHLPEFLNTKNEKLVIVNHKEFMDDKYLPTYNSNSIDLNLHKIKGLNEKFVYFNDDTFIIDKVNPNDFFKNGKPKEEFAETATLPYDTIFAYTLFNNAFILNKYFDKRSVYKKYWYKLYSLKYGKNNIRTIISIPYHKFVGFYMNHLPISFNKSSFERMWNLEGELLDSTCKNKFRTKEDINLYLIKHFQQLEGNFYPRSNKFGKYYIIKNDNKKIIDTITKQKYKIICTNDKEENIDFKKAQKELIDAFEKILPEKSSFEK